MAAGRKNTAPQRQATTAQRGRPAGKSAPPKAAAPARPKAPTGKAAQKAAPSRTTTRQPPSRRAAPKVEPGLTAQLESMAQELGQIRAARVELKGLRRLVEALTGMVEGLVATQRGQGGKPEPEPTAEARHASARDADPGAADE